MAYQVLARKYRPETFDEVLGQDHIVKTLVRSLKNDRIGHAYIFSGPRGIGKTTTARLLAKAVNCADESTVEPCNECESCEQISEDRDVDVIEIDGASNNSVDQIRTLRENVQYSPAHSDKKVYIIDEVHMLSRSAFNALLKTLEEPPEHVIFIFATTEIEKVPETILSRCQRFDFRLVPQKMIVDCLESICQKEDIPVEKEALFLIAKFAGGSLRDAQSILDQMINFTGAGEKKITQDLVSKTWGLAPYDRLIEIIEAIQESNQDLVISRVHDHVNAGHDLMALVADLTEMFRNCLLLKETREGSDFLNRSIPGDIIPDLKKLAEDFTRTELTWCFDQLLELHDRLGDYSRFRIELTEVTFVKLIRGRPRYSLGEVTDRLESLETKSDPSGSKVKRKPSKAATKPSKKTKEQSGQSSADEQRDQVKSQPDKNEEKPDGPGEQKTRQEPAKEDRRNRDSKDQADEWEKILGAIPNPAQAYLRNSNEVKLADGCLKIWFDPGWSNHVEHLQKEKNQATIRDAAREVTGEAIEVEISVNEQPEGTSGQPGQEKKNAVEKKTDETGEPRLVSQAREIFDVDEVEKVESN